MIAGVAGCDQLEACKPTPLQGFSLLFCSRCQTHTMHPCLHSSSSSAFTISLPPTTTQPSDASRTFAFVFTTSSLPWSDTEYWVRYAVQATDGAVCCVSVSSAQDALYAQSTVPLSSLLLQLERLDVGLGGTITLQQTLTFTLAGPAQEVSEAQTEELVFLLTFEVGGERALVAPEGG